MRREAAWVDSSGVTRMPTADANLLWNDRAEWHAWARAVLEAWDR